VKFAGLSSTTTVRVFRRTIAFDHPKRRLLICWFALRTRVASLGSPRVAVVRFPKRSKLSEPEGTTIWAPVLGENSRPALRAIHEFLSPDDTCPVLPFPALHPRRADALLLEYQRELFDEFQVGEGNLIYADEHNPFDLYRTLSRLQADYAKALRPLEPTTLALSTHSSKLLSLGVLLAAYEHQLPIVAATATDYAISDGVDFAELGVQNKLSCLWLSGEPYA
jgi:hypothetical protein